MTHRLLGVSESRTPWHWQRSDLSVPRWEAARSGAKTWGVKTIAYCNWALRRPASRDNSKLGMEENKVVAD